MFNELGYPAFQDAIFNTILVIHVWITAIPAPHLISRTPVSYLK
jgi:hypothetical protein